MLLVKYFGINFGLTYRTINCHKKNNKIAKKGLDFLVKMFYNRKADKKTV